MFGPWSILAATSEGILQREAQKLLDELIVSEDDSLLADSKSAPHVLDRVRGKSVGAGDVYK
jgi:hypothetical protein